MSLVGDIVRRMFGPKQDRANRLLRFYIHHRNLYMKGQTELGLIRNLISYQALVITYLGADNILMKLGWGIPLWVVFASLGLAVFIKNFIQWYAGYLWNKYRVFDKEADWSNLRNPISKAVNKQLLNGAGIEGKG